MLSWIVAIELPIPIPIYIVMEPSNTTKVRVTISAITRERYDISDYMFKYEGVDAFECLLVACADNLVHCVKHLCSMTTISPDDDNNAAMTVACNYGCIDIVKYLHNEHNVLHTNFKYNSNIFFEACRHGHSDICRYLVSTGYIDPYANDHVALNIACEYGHLDVVKYLCGLIGTPQRYMQYALYVACKHDSLNIVKYLCERQGVDAYIGEYAILIASQYNNCNVVKYLCDITGKNPLGYDELFDWIKLSDLK